MSQPDFGGGRFHPMYKQAWAESVNEEEVDWLRKQVVQFRRTVLAQQREKEELLAEIAGLRREGQFWRTLLRRAKLPEKERLLEEVIASLSSNEEALVHRDS